MLRLMNSARNLVNGWPPHPRHRECHHFHQGRVRRGQPSWGCRPQSSSLDARTPAGGGPSFAPWGKGRSCGNGPEIHRGGHNRVPISVPKSNSRILLAATSSKTKIDRGESRRSPENPSVPTRNRAAIEKGGTPCRPLNCESLRCRSGPFRGRPACFVERPSESRRRPARSVTVMALAVEPGLCRVGGLPARPSCSKLVLHLASPSPSTSPTTCCW